MKSHNYVLFLLVFASVMSCGGDDGDGGTITTYPSTDVTADKDGMSASVGDTGVYTTVEFNVNADGSVTKFAAGDGWTVEFDKFLITINDFHAVRVSGEGASLSLDETAVVDLTKIPGSALTLMGFDRVEAGQFSSVGFAMPRATSETTKAASTLEDDLALMIAGGYSVYVEGIMTKADGQSCAPDAPMDCISAEQIVFRWGFGAGTAYANCAGFAVYASTDLFIVELLMTGETWFAPGFSETDYNAAKRAQWIADADLDRDGETTFAELKSIKASQLFPPALGYDFTGAPISVETAYDFVEAQARNLGRHSYGYCTTSRAL